MRLSVAFLMLLGLLCPSPASAYVTLIGADPDANIRYDQWQRASLVPMPYATVPVQQRNCDGPAEPGRYACEFGVEGGPQNLVMPNMEWLWTEPDRERDQAVYQFVFYHELVHVRDYQKRKTRRYRARFSRIMGFPAKRDDGPRLGSKSTKDYSWGPSVAGVPQYETFAQAGAQCSTNLWVANTKEWKVGYNYFPTDAQHRAVCRLFQESWR